MNRIVHCPVISWTLNLEAENVPESLLDTGEIVRMERGQRTFDEAFLNRHQIRKASRAGMAQAQVLPVPQRMIAATGPVVEARLAADRAGNHIRQSGVKRVGVKHERRNGR